MRQDEGRTVVWVRLGATVCERIEVEQFDAVLRDLGLPDVDGIALLRELRMMAGSPAKAALPVIILSSRDGLEERLRGFHAGADDYLVKPLHVPELLARLRAVVRRTQGEGGAMVGFALVIPGMTLVGLVNALYDAKSTAGCAGARAMRPAASGSSACTRWTTSGC
ncbi:response regulator [Massilia sp. TWP1-3-3]|uniref:response regulator n=1 Tax=Massilia sp. TWP1-3-3 TaxID=2804573 RepID=UPI003CF6C35C